MTETQLCLLHMVRAIDYRAQRAQYKASPSFLDFSGQNGIRTPREILAHMAHVLNVAIKTVGATPAKQATAENFRDVLQDLYNAISSRSIDRDVADKIIQGPISDALTHIGQLAMLRRLAGDPVTPENFMLPELKGSIAPSETNES